MLGKSFFLKPWYPCLLSIFFVLHGFTANFYLIPVKDSLLLLLAYLVGAIVFTFSFWLFFRNLAKASFFSFLIMGFNFFFGYIHDSLKSFFPDSFVIKYSVILSAFFLVFVILAIILKKRKSISDKLTVYLNLLLCIFIIIDFLGIIKKGLSYNGEKNSVAANVSACKETSIPDVYLIVADEYAGSKDLTDICGFDNSPFLDSLREKGFFVANNSRSNYNFTSYSMASLLNMDYLSIKKGQIKRVDHLAALKLIFNNRVTDFFKEAGYEFHNYSFFDISGQNAQDKNSFVPARTELFTSQTLVNRLKKDVWINLAGMLNLRSVVKKSLLETLISNEQSYQHTINTAHTTDTVHKFVYTHLALPHYPYYYDKNGNPYPYEKILKDEPGNKENYIQYLQYTNKVLLKLVNEIIQTNRTPPVIILMSDHGYRCYPTGADA